MHKKPEFDFHKPFLVSLVVIALVVVGFSVSSNTQKNIQQNSAAVALSKTTTTAGPPNPGQTVAQKVFLMGGHASAGNYLNDVWQSNNGATWNLISPYTTTPIKWSGRQSPTSFYLNGKIFILGGGPIVPTNDIWSSNNGIDWVQVDADSFTGGIQNLPWMTYNTKTVVLSNKVYAIAQIGGGLNLHTEVWRSDTGADWIHLDADSTTSGIQDPPWSFISSAGVTVGDGKIWFFEGFNSSGVGYSTNLWASPDGQSWTLVSTMPGTGRLYSQVAFLNGKVVVMGGISGFSPNMIELNDIWAYDPLSTIWTHVDTDTITNGIQDAPWQVRSLGSVFVLNNNLYITGGQYGNNTTTLLGDSWRTADLVSWEHVDADPGINGVQDPLWGSRYAHTTVVTPATFGLPDLTITNLTFRNQPIHVSTTNPYVYYDVTVKNNSSTIPVVLPATGNTFQINLTSIPSAVPSGDLATITVGTPITLQPGQSHTFSNVSTRYDSTIRATARTYRITAKADALNLITEVNETNNTYATNLTIIP